MSIFITAVALFATTIYILYQRYRRRCIFIEDYSWPPGLTDKLARQHPALTAGDIDKVGRGLKQFFRSYLDGGCQPVAMPSEVADDLWHDFILYTRHYDHFCQKAFGRFLHHTPAAVLDASQKATNAGLRRVWWHCCKQEGIDPKVPTRLPLLFALDRDLEIPGGKVYHPDCERLRNEHGVTVGYCAGDFSSTSCDGTTDGFGDGGGGDGDGGGGCGGD